MDIIIIILTGLRWLIIIDAVLSWTMPADKFPRTLTGQITEPLYAPIRAILPPQKTGGVDLSPLLVLLLLHGMEMMLHKARPDAF